MIKNLYVRHEFLNSVKVAKHWGFKKEFIRLYKHYRRTTNYAITSCCYEALLDLDLFGCLPKQNMSVFNLQNKEKANDYV